MIKLLDVTKKYGNKKILDNLSYIFEDKKRYLILGESGIGKTTLLRTISGIETIDSGRISIDDMVCTNKAKCIVDPSYRNIGYIFQNPVIYPHMNIRKNILLSFEEKPKDKEEKIDTVLNEFGILHLKKAMPQNISTGEAKRVALAMIFAKNPKYMLLDEPLTNLDNENKETVIKYMINILYKIDSLLIYVTHDTNIANRIDAIKLRLKNGKLEEVK